ncbi:MAG: 30S ribosomal protein S16 [candidate division WWE3 bacterium]|nr:30S ribosomal protein S16 [candidate division WWE3 bacterium]
MLVIKLMRTGKRNLPAFRVAVTDGKKVVEFLGSYYPHPKSPSFAVAEDRIKYWVKSGAQPTEAVKDLLKGKYEFKPYVRTSRFDQEPSPVGSVMRSEAAAAKPSETESPPVVKEPASEPAQPEGATAT